MNEIRAMANTQLSEQEILRRESMNKLREIGIEPYPAPLYPVNTTTKAILEGFDPEKGNFADVCIAGRIMSRRIMGAASFMELQDEEGRIQVYVKRDEICPGEDKTMYNTVFKKLLDIGDIVGIKGFAFFTQTGQLSVHAKDGGRKRIRLPFRAAKVVDLLSDRVVAEDCTSFEDDFSSPDTKIYEMVR